MKERIELNVFDMLHSAVNEYEKSRETFEEHLLQSKKETEAYEDAFKKKNKLYRAFCRANGKGTATLEEAEDCAIHILADVLSKKLMCESDEEKKKVFDTFHRKLINSILEYREHFAFLLAWGAASKEARKTE